MGQTQRTITISQRLRPVRLAFLVKPTDKASLRRAFQINTCLWGGIFNPIIPFFRRTPKWWADEPPRLPSASSIQAGYLDNFEPDYAVSMHEDTGRKSGVADCSMLSESDVLDPQREYPVGHGLEVTELYADLYKREFQFQRRHPARVISAHVDEPNMELFGAMCFGQFPPDESLSYMAERYQKCFDAAPVSVDASNLLHSLASGTEFQLRMGCRGIEHHWSTRMSSEPALFFMDAKETIDLIDFWNLRAVGRYVRPVPRQWADKLLPACSRFVTENYVPDYFNKDYMHRTTLIRSRSVSEEECLDFIGQLDTPAKDAISYQRWYPRMWEPWAIGPDHVTRCNLAADEADHAVSIEDGHVPLTSLCPTFADRYRGNGTPRWANVLRIKDYGFSGEFATVIPPGLRDIHRLLRTFSRHPARTTREGIVLLEDHHPIPAQLRLPVGLDVLRASVQSHSYDVDLSSNGRLVLQLIHSLGGLPGVGAIANDRLIKLLNSMASGQVESNEDDPQLATRRRRTRGRILSAGEMLSRLGQIVGDGDTAEQRLGFLIRRNVLRVGLRVKCAVCGQHNWYSLDGITEELTCERCLRHFCFPSTRPPLDGWYYRTVGPFSIEDYASGSYCVALVLRLLGPLMTGEQTWIPSFTLKRPGFQDIEADFATFWCESPSRDNDPLFIIGECKTFGTFADKDIRRMREFGEAFPGAVLALCTLRDELTEAEKRRIASLARWGRKYLTAGRWRSPVLVLTGTEILAPMTGPPLCWRDKGTRFDELSERYHQYCGMHGITTALCDITQQLHLGIESYWEWLDAERTKRAARRKKT